MSRAQVADALDHAHRRGVVHRDVKPGNILVGADERARLADFGIARSLEEGAARLTQTGTVVGTPRYMAPEQLRGERVTQQTDIYALGAVLYEMLAGHPVFVASTPVGIAEEQQRPPAPLTGVSPSLAAVTATALRPNPGERPRTAAAMAAALRASLSNAETVAMRPPAAAAAALPLRGSPAAAAVGRPGGRSIRSRPLVAILGAALGLVAVVLVSAVLSAPDADRVPAVDETAPPVVAPVPTPEPTTVVVPVVEAEEGVDQDRGRDRDRGRGNDNGRDRDEDEDD